MPPSRPVRCTLASTDEKAKILKSGKLIRNSNTDLFNPKTIFFVPDQTYLERQDDTKLRKALKKKREDFPNKTFTIKSRKIIEIEEKNSNSTPSSPQASPNRTRLRGSRTIWSQSQSP